MGVYDRDYYRSDEPRGFQLALGETIVVRLIVINVAVFLVDLVTEGQLSQWGALQAKALLEPWLLWQGVTYGFLHSRDSFQHILFNMLALWFFGSEIEGVYGKKLFLRLYLSFVIFSGLVWVAVTMWQYPRPMLPIFHAIGASGAIAGILTLFVLHFPRRTIYLHFLIPVPAWLLGVLYLASDIGGLLGVTQGTTPIAYAAHLGGVAAGALYYMTGWSLLSWFPQEWSLRGLRGGRRSPRLRVRAEPTAREQELSDQADAVLEKIARSGQDSLTAEERRILADYSRRMQQKHR